jgi:hypothetical protein
MRKYNFTNFKIAALAMVLILSFVLCGCSPSLKVEVKSADLMSLEFTTGFSDVLEETLYSITGIDENGTLFEEKVVTNNLEQAGFSVDSINVSDNNLYVKTKADKAKILNDVAPELIREISENLIDISISPENLQSVLAVLPEETVGYVDLLCAPIFTYEELSPEEYCEVLSAIYGKTLALEALESNFTIEILVPNLIKKINVKLPNAVTQTEKNKVIITIPLVDFLCNLEESIISVSW